MRLRSYRYMAVACIILLIIVGAAGALATGERTKHFDIVYATGLQPADGDRLAHTLENAYDEINGYYGTLPDRVKALVVGKKAMDEVGPHVEAFSAWNKRSSAIVLREETLETDKQPVLDVVVKHELSHLGINNILCNKEPKQFAWMEEGLCMVLSKEPLSDRKVSKFIQKQGFLSPPEIADAVKNENYNVTKDGYLQSWSLINYMVRTFGTRRVIDMLRCPENNFDEAFKLNTGMDFGSFYKQWEDHVAEEATVAPQPMIPAFGRLSFGKALINLRV
jgi:hypothetical protein